MDIPEMLPSWATRRSNGQFMVPGSQLATKDGRRMGNAYVDSLSYHIDLGSLALVVTDMGNSFKMTEQELSEAFHAPRYIMSVAEARKTRGMRLVQPPTTQKRWCWEVQTAQCNTTKEK